MRARGIGVLPLVLTLGLAACGGGGGEGGTAAPATVGVLVTDATTLEWDQAIATITSVRLIGDSRQVTLFSGSETLDLLQLADFSELFAVADDVPAGTYSKIRLQLSDLVLNKLDPVTGLVIETERPQLVGNGKIDLNPRGPFVVGPGDVIFVELDFDMEKSLKITETGNGRLILRPVVFVDIRSDRPDGRFSRIHGEITNIDPLTSRFRLCQTNFASHWDDDEDEGDDRPFFGENHCVTVLSGAATGIFDGEGLPQDFAGLEVGEEATAIGRLRHFDDDEPLIAGDFFTLDAVIVEEGPLGTFSRIRGTTASLVDALTDQFLLDVAPGQGFGSDTTLAVQLYAQSRIFNRDGEERSRLDIQTDRGALVDGVLQLGGTDVLRSPLVILDLGAPVGEALLEGDIATVDLGDQRLIVSTETGDRCVHAGDADVFLVNDNDGFSSVHGELGDLVPGQEVAIFGHEGIDGCVIAETILAAT